jgi:RNA polymerase sigma factor (sigma-70 family)
LDDQSCIRALAAGGWRAEQAAAVLYQRYAPAFLGWLQAGSRSFRAQDAEEIVQEAFLNIVRKAREGIEVGRPESYLWQTLRNTMVDFLRRSARIPATVPESAEGHGPGWYDTTPDGADPLAELANDCVAEVWEWFERAHSEWGLVLSLQHFYGVSLSAISQAIDRSYEATRQVASTARRAFLDRVFEKCGSAS